MKKIRTITEYQFDSYDEIRKLGKGVYDYQWSTVDDYRGVMSWAIILAEDITDYKPEGWDKSDYRVYLYQETYGDPEYKAIERFELEILVASK